MRFRLAREDDLATCRALLHPAFRLDPGVRDELVRLWTGLLASGTFVVIEDPARPHPDAIEAFGSSVFVTDAFVEAFSKRPRPYLSAIIYGEMLAGRSPVLSVPQVRDANSSAGLNLVVLHFGLRHHDMSDARTQAALQMGSAAFYFCHVGYQLKLLLNEVYGQQHAGYMSAGGFRLLTDFEGGSSPELVDVRREHRPFLFIQRKEWMAPAAVNPLSFLFHAPRPQLGFSETEQRVLLRALFSESDVQIAAALDVTLDTVKRAWRRAYERVGHVAPYLLGGGSQTRAADRRGTEKRRHLLEYLRGHLEELRPYAVKARSVAL